MAKHEHEFRDPIHVFIRVSSDERRVIDSRAFQRLRHIHQLALTCLVYPGATHRRFEHSLGVMELAGRVFDVITNPAHILFDEVREVLPPNRDMDYWRKVLRIAALLHDVGHLPFSHAAEADLLPSGWNHERLTERLIDDPELSGLFSQLTPPIKPEVIKKLAVGRKHLKNVTFSAWEELLSEVITGDVFGVDRMDYLLRDAYHCGVAYGRFDHYRLVDCLRILPKQYADTDELALGIDEGGLHSAEALLLARYFMFTQVYLHPVRRIYDIHLQDFLKEWLPKGKFDTTAAGHLKFTDNEVTAAIRAAAGKKSGKGVNAARRIVTREHFKLCYSRHPEDVKVQPEAASIIYAALAKKYGKDKVRFAPYDKSGKVSAFPMLSSNGDVVNGLEASEVLTQFPPTILEHVFVAPQIRDDALKWLQNNKNGLISNSTGIKNASHKNKPSNKPAKKKGK